MKTRAVVLAAGLGKRMKSSKKKELHTILGMPILEHVLRTLEGAGFAHPVVVVGNEAQAVEAALGARADFALQREQRGTADALAAALPALGDADEVIVVYGDVPCLRVSTVVALAQAKRGVRAALLSAMVTDPAGYGRILRDANGQFRDIREDKDASPSERNIHEVNAGIYVFERADLASFLSTVGTENAQGEAYLPDLPSLLLAEGGKVRVLVTDDPKEIAGVNDRLQLAEAEATLRLAILDRWMEDGVTVHDPATTWVEPDVQLARDVTLHPGTHLRGRTKVGAGTEIGPEADVSDSTIGKRCRIVRSVVESSRMGDEVTVGPFSHIRPGCEIGDSAEVGNFAELKKTSLGARSKCHHHSYLGDATIGCDVNIGAGVITVNYDRGKKFPTFIGDGAFIGCNVNIIAPRTVGERAYVAAGSTLTHDVPAAALAVARERQRNIEGWVNRRKKGEEE